MLTQNSKMKKSSLKTFNFSLPEVKTCPQAGECKTFCYAAKGFYHLPTVKNHKENNYQLSLKTDFSINMFDEIVTRKLDRVRIHDSGDFYNLTYTAKWLELAHSLPHVTFYAYTKSIPIFRYMEYRNRIPENFITIYSFGGKKDYQINTKIDRFAVIYHDEGERKYYLDNDYIDASESDDFALTNNKKIKGETMSYIILTLSVATIYAITILFIEGVLI